MTGVHKRYIVLIWHSIFTVKQVLILILKILKMLKKSWADHLFHLSYGMVNLLHGKMKSHASGVVASLHAAAAEPILLMGGPSCLAGSPRWRHGV